MHQRFDAVVRLTECLKYGDEVVEILPVEGAHVKVEEVGTTTTTTGGGGCCGKIGHFFLVSDAFGI